MATEYSVLLSTLVKEHELGVVNTSSDYEEAQITSMAVGRPGLQFAGFFEYFDPRRMLVSGKQENTYLERLDATARYVAIERLMEKKPCALIICHHVVPVPEITELAKKHLYLRA